MDPHVSDEEIVDLLNELLSSERREAIGEHVRECAPCAEVVRERSAVFENMRSRSASVAQELARPPVASAAHRFPPRAWSRFRRLAVPAAVAVLALILSRSLGDTPADIPAVWIPVPEGVTTRSTSGDWAPLVEGLVAYEGRNALAAVELLESADAGSIETVRRIFLASALFHADRAQECVALLDRRNLRVVPIPWKNYARWTLMVALRAVGRQEDAVAVLEELLVVEGEIGDLAREHESRLRE